jgi:hypothetical protein
VTHRTLNLCYLAVILDDCNVMMPNVSPIKGKPARKKKQRMKDFVLRRKEI